MPAGCTSFGQDAAPLARFRLGGPFRLSARQRDEFTSNNYLLAEAGYLHSIYDLPPIIGGRVYLYGGVETGSSFDRWRQSRSLTNFNGGIVITTGFGPLSVGGSFGENGRSRAYFSIGRFF